MTDKCSICLDDLHDNIGVAVPCGHCLHRGCFESLKTDNASRVDNDDGIAENTEVMPRCPVCKKKIKKFYNVFMTFQHQDDVSCEASCADALKAVARITGENIHLNKRLVEMRNLSKDQSELLFRILPQYDELESNVSRIKLEKKEMTQKMRDLSEENASLLSEWNDSEVQLELVNAKKNKMERRLKETGEENLDLHFIWDELDAKLDRSKSKKKVAKMALKRKAEELDGTKDQVARLACERKELEARLEQTSQEAAQWRNETTKLRRKIKRIKRKQKE